MRKLRILTSLAKRSYKALVTATWVKGQLRESRITALNSTIPINEALTKIQRLRARLPGGLVAVVAGAALRRSFRLSTVPVL